MSGTRENTQNIKSPTVVVEQQCKKFCPPAPLESGIGLPQELASMDQRSILVEQVHVLSNVAVRRVSPVYLMVTYDILSNFEDQVGIIPPQFDLLLS